MILNNSSRGLLLENDKVLFIEYTIEGETFYSLPGGTVETGENLKECVIREFKEETGIPVKVNSLILINEFISPNPKSVAPRWKNGIHQIESIFTVQRNPDVQVTKRPEQLDFGMRGVRWMTRSELKHVIYYPEKPINWFFLGDQMIPNIYVTKRY